MENEITPEDEVRAENELLKLKLEMEHGMSDMDVKSLSTDAENQWLNYIYNFEKEYKDAQRIKVLEFIGNPTYKSISEIEADEIPQELERVLGIMADNNVAIDFICDYADELKYRFITEELFECETDNMRIDGMMHCFIYEEFHPNHDYDLRRHGEDFLRWLFTKTWTEDCAKYEMTKTIRFQDKEYDGHGITQIILAFQDEAKKFDVKNNLITEVSFDMDQLKGHVKIALSYDKYWTDGSITEHSGDCYLYFESEYDWWGLSGFSLPGLDS
jgi:hypothetical protein